jgi:hypothetical protein
MANDLKIEKKVQFVSLLQVAVSHLHYCGAIWHETVPVYEVFQGKTVWQGDVEVFNPNNHPLLFWKSRQWIQRKKRFKFKSLRT